MHGFGLHEWAESDRARLAFAFHMRFTKRTRDEAHKSGDRLVDGYARIEQLAWDGFHEGHTLQAAVEAYRDRYSCYPEAVLADKVYRNR
ncbi:hypothetical protein CVV65_06085 [Kyrpidia spormannii]|uniref:Uncharacterized protein n=1 Tax=Kyrpidia spormannii TaxID=2055160 RepID=A0A2K8N6Z3_9BACL|nr:hypothetical protein CVV65_06085 [Kyrpidia spormannii]